MIYRWKGLELYAVVEDESGDYRIYVRDQEVRAFKDFRKTDNWVSVPGEKIPDWLKGELHKGRD